MQSVSAGREAGGPGSAPPPEEERDPIDRALRASRRAYAPYSRFRVGAVLEDGRGRLYEGCNLECASLGMSVCAERTALGVAWTDGARSFRRIWIYTPTPRATVPCGACRLPRFAGAAALSHPTRAR